MWYVDILSIFYKRAIGCWISWYQLRTLCLLKQLHVPQWKIPCHLNVFRAYRIRQSLRSKLYFGYYQTDLRQFGAISYCQEFTNISWLPVFHDESPYSLYILLTKYTVIFNSLLEYISNWRIFFSYYTGKISTIRMKLRPSETVDFNYLLIKLHFYFAMLPSPVRGGILFFL